MKIPKGIISKGTAAHRAGGARIGHDLALALRWLGLVWLGLAWIGLAWLGLAVQASLTGGPMMAQASKSERRGATTSTIVMSFRESGFRELHLVVCRPTRQGQMTAQLRTFHLPFHVFLRCSVCHRCGISDQELVPAK